MRPRWISADAVERAVSMAAAIDVLEAALVAGLDPEQDGSRTRMDVDGGELLQMPSANAQHLGTKIITIRPANEGTPVPVIQGLYVLFDGASMSPVAMIDGAALTTLRTPAVSGLVARHLAGTGASRMALFGTGVQAWGHVQAVRAVRELRHVDVIGRTPAHVERMVERIRGSGIDAVAAGADAVAAADLVVCATGAVEPLFDGSLVADHALTIAIGTHDPTAREVDSVLARRSAVVVESRASALREAGDVVVPIGEGAITEADLIGLADVVRGTATVVPDRPRLFKGTGMPWQDLAVAGAVADAVIDAADHASTGD